MYVRFVIATQSENAYRATGILTIAHELMDKGRIEPYAVEVLKDNAVAWFRDNATMFVNQMWDAIKSFGLDTDRRL